MHNTIWLTVFYRYHDDILNFMNCCKYMDLIKLNQLNTIGYTYKMQKTTCKMYKRCWRRRLLVKWSYILFLCSSLNWRNIFPTMFIYILQVDYWKISVKGNPEMFLSNVIFSSFNFIDLEKYNHRRTQKNCMLDERN
jgi:hypothetical protein